MRNKSKSLKSWFKRKRKSKDNLSRLSSSSWNRNSSKAYFWKGLWLQKWTWTFTLGINLISSPVTPYMKVNLKLEPDKKIQISLNIMLSILCYRNLHFKLLLMNRVEPWLNLREFWLTIALRELKESCGRTRKNTISHFSGFNDLFGFSSSLVQILLELSSIILNCQPVLLIKYSNSLIYMLLRARK